MNVGYCAVFDNKESSFINWTLLNKHEELIEETTYFKHVRFKKPLEILMDGKKRIALIRNIQD